MMVGWVAGCGGPRGDANPDGIGDPPPPDYALLARAQNQRIGKLTAVRASGRIELRWRDDGGGHFEQADLDLSLARPDRVYLSVKKLGERFLWFGADAGSAWLFDFRDDQTILYCASAEVPFSPDVPGGDLIDPARIQVLCGLGILPESRAQAPVVSHDAGRKAWCVTVEDPRGLTRLYLDRASLLPVEVEIFDLEGRRAFRSVIHADRYRRVSQRGVAPLDRPQFPTLLDITGRGDGEVKIALDEPDDQVNPRLFDLRWLVDTFEPKAIDGPCLPP